MDVYGLIGWVVPDIWSEFYVIAPLETLVMCSVLILPTVCGCVCVCAHMFCIDFTSYKFNCNEWDVWPDLRVNSSQFTFIFEKDTEDSAKLEISLCQLLQKGSTNKTNITIYKKRKEKEIRDTRGDQRLSYELLCCWSFRVRLKGR